MTRKIDALLNSFYETYDEDNRLEKDKVNNVEFIIYKFIFII